jgi:hypothetical protein
MTAARGFDIPDDAAVVTTTYVTRDRMPVLLVSHEQDDEDGTMLWQFHSGNGDYSPEKLQLVRLNTVLSLDPSLKEVASLPVGYSAVRATPNDPWVFRPEQ